MLVFISWSGQKSRFVAEGLESWLAQVIQAAEPWISRDIDKGLRWGGEIASRLRMSRVGIICLTRSNLDSRWLHFEAGALSKTDDAYVCTLLVDVKPSDVGQPLGQFQHTTTEKRDIFQLLTTINRLVGKSGGKALAEARLSDIFEVYWPHLERVFQQAASVPESPAPPRPVEEMLQEMLNLLRHQGGRKAGEEEQARYQELLDAWAEPSKNRRLEEQVAGLLDIFKSGGRSPAEAEDTPHESTPPTN